MIRKMRISFVLISLCLVMTLSLLSSFIIVGCGRDTQNENELSCESFGVYFITDKCYESIVRNCAIKVGADERWVKDVLNGGDGGEWYYMIRPKSWFRCVIADNQITISNYVDTVYDISNDGNTYQGTSIINTISSTISFWLSGDILYVNDNNETLQYKKDNSYQRAETQDSILAAPRDVMVSSGGEGLNYVMLSWDYNDDYGTIGAAIEVKKANSNEYKMIKIDRVYMNGHVMQLDESAFEVGENSVRIYHIGGPSITNDHSIIVKKNSEYATFCVKVSDDWDVEVEKINS